MQNCIFIGDSEWGEEPKHNHLSSVFFVAGFRTLLVSLLPALVSSLINRSKSVSAADSPIGNTRFDKGHRIPTPVSDEDIGDDSSDSDEVASQDNLQEVNSGFLDI